MKNTNILFRIIVIFLALIIYSVFIFQKCETIQETSEPTTIVQYDRNKSKEDSLITARAIVLLYQKDSIIQTLKSNLVKDKANAATQKAEAKIQHTLNDTLQAQFKKNKNLNTCEDLVDGLMLEIIEKDSLIICHDYEIENYSCEVEALEEQINIQKKLIESKQNMINYKDSTLANYLSQKKKTDIWNKGKIKVASAIIFIETIALLIK